LCSVSQQYLGDTGDLRRSFRGSATVVTGNEDMDIAAALNSGCDGIKSASS
jgi:hypothetical protein